ncbi:DNA cytosine methyltransferase, partial [Salmonella enterica subsp. enterica serovar Anatum]|nr:DNA cytosine methyltransferase [Salmonella enterica subsp. enterica serovar Anatum]
EAPQTYQFRIPVSDTQAYRQFGNSVVVPVFAAVAKLLEPKIHLFFHPPAAVHPHTALHCSAARTSLVPVLPAPASYPASPATAD